MYKKTDNVRVKWHWSAFANHCCRGKPKVLHMFVCACACVNVALLIQHATRMCHTVTSLVVPLAPLYFSTLSHKRRDIRKNVVEYKYRFDFLHNFYLEKFSEILSKMWKSLHVKYPYLCRILTKFEFSQKIFEKSLNFSR